MHERVERQFERTRRSAAGPPNRAVAAIAKGYSTRT